ncbi:MAG: Rv1355c family protein [Bacteroidia bacterium]
MQLAFQKCSDLDWEPYFIDPRTAEGKKQLALLSQDVSVQVHDTIFAQVGEMLKSRYPKKKLKDASLNTAINDFFENIVPSEYGMWVYYPWSRRLVHILSEEDFIATRISPNNPKITKEEQALLRKKKVGVVGLSVGQSISLVLTMERICGEIRIADFDELELPNLNRIRTGLHNMGLKKTVVVAREILEIDPYFKIRCFTEGLIRENMDAFFNGDGDLDLVVDECDSIDIKILLRKKARSMKIPVVMDMSDRGTIDVERFDLEPERPILHGWIDHLDLTRLNNLTNEEKVPYMLPIFGMDTISKRLKASMVEIGETIHTWPQLATSVAMGGALAADTVRRIFLDQFHESGRYFIDLDQLIQDKNESGYHFEPEKFSFPALKTESLIHEAQHALNDLGWETGGLKEEDLDPLITLTSMAPSAGNNQPWKWVSLKGHLFLFHEKSRTYSWTDYDDSLAYLSLGACSESLKLAAERMGYAVEIHPIGKNQLVAAFKIKSEPGKKAGELAMGLEMRCTNRKKADYVPVPESLIHAIQQHVAELPGMEAHIFSDKSSLQTWANVVGQTEKIRSLIAQAHYEFFHDEVRWTEKEALETRDGLDVGTMELTPVQEAGLHVSSDPEVLELIRQWKVGDGFAQGGIDAVNASSALCLITCDPGIPESSLVLGGAVLRAWITANLQGWSVHPVSAPLFFFNRVEKMNNGLDPEIMKEIRSLKAEIDKITTILRSRRGVFLFRLSWCEPPSKRSLRLHNKNILIRGDVHF